MKKLKTNYLKKIFGIGILLFAFNNSKAQTNYIGNGSFETVTTCPNRMTNSGVGANTFDPNRFPYAWIKPTNGSPDLINNCPNTYSYNSTINPGGPWVWSLDNIEGCQPAQNGYNYIGLYTTGSALYGGGPFREMIQSEITLSGGLVAGQCYVLEFYASLADYSEYTTPLQVNFSSTSQTQYDNVSGYYGTMGLTANLTTRAITHTGSWEHIVFPYTAIGGEKYMTIGFFEDEDSPNIVAVTPATGNCTLSHQQGTSAYIYIDNVSLTFASGDFTPTAGHVFSNTTLNNINWSNSNVLLDGNITLTGASNQITDCDVRCTKTCRITIDNSASLTTDGTVFSSGCDHMWEGFVLNTTSSGLFMTGGTNGGGIHDAVTAITNLHGRPLQLSDNLLFKGNETDIIEDNIGTSGSFIKGTTFDHTIALKDISYGVGGYGIEGIKILGQTGVSTLVVGGTTLADMCQFLGGQYGIESHDANVEVKRCLFSGVQEIAVDFQGSNANNTLRSLRVVNGTTFIGGKRHVFSQHRTDLTIQQCSFVNAQQNAIEWSDNHDGHLYIGDTTNPSFGNTFYGNYWNAITVWDNKTNFSGAPEDFIDSTAGDFTTIFISHNIINAPIGGSGFLIGEWALGQYASYRMFKISNNTLNNVTKGISLYNTRGLGGLLPPDSIGTLSQDIIENAIHVTTAATASAFGIQEGNAPGFELVDNTIISDAPGSALNIGIIADDCRYSNIFRNDLVAGTGISVNHDVFNSNIHCNATNNNTKAIYLNRTNLRAAGQYHGTGNEGYFNNITTYFTWQDEIVDDNSDVALNQWVWTADPLPTVVYIGNTGTGVLFATATGDDNCDIPISEFIKNDGTNPLLDLGDADQQWLADYNYEIIRLNTGIGDSTVASGNIKKIIHVETMIDTANYTAANTVLAALTPANDFEQNYKDVLSVFASINYPDHRDPDEGEMETLTTVAEKFSRTDGPAVFLARAYLAEKFNMSFKDEVDLTGTLAGTATINTPCSILPYSKTYLGFIDEYGHDLGVTPTVIEADGSFLFDASHLALLSSTTGDTTYRIYSTPNSRYTVVDKEFKTIADWLDESPVALTMSGVDLYTDTLENVAIDTATVYEDSDGNIYKVGATSATNNDFLLEKYDSDKNLLWTRTFDGAAKGDDTATCITADIYGNIYIAGKLWNGLHYEVQAMKYDVDGFLQWSSVIADSTSDDNYPTGISVDPDKGNVSVTGKLGTKGTHRYMQWNQCFPSEGGGGVGILVERHMQEDTGMEVSANAIDFYPNPSTGKLNIILPDANGGLLELFNPEGQLMFSQRITQSGEIEIPQNSVPDGLYLLKFTGEGHTEFNKLVIHRD